jgi:glycosyltransferase involved in cell wall biosynthesis
VIPNGVDERFYHADPTLFVQEYGVRDFVLNVGHIGTGRKNVLSLVRALKNIDHPAVIIGKVQENAYSRQTLNEAALNPNIRIIEGLANDSPLLASAYAAARVFAFPSRYETPGIAALEAGLAGASVVITPYGGTRDYFGNDAIYVEPDSVDSIADGIRRALQSERSTALRERIRREYLWPVVAEKTAAAYRAALART